ncbi:MAG: class I SAM-dependent methyltransferase [Rhodospirillales bacterium]
MRVELDSGIVANFPRVSLSQTRDGCHGISDDGLYSVKVQFGRFENKENDLEREVEIMRYLESRGCVTCPEVLGYGEIDKEALIETLEKNQINLATEIEADKFRYLVMPAYTALETIYTPDISMAIIEQKKLGVWQGDISSDHILTDPRTSCIKLVDYDQAIYLTDEQRDMPNLEYFHFIDEEQRERFKMYNVSGWMREFSNISWDTHFAHLFDGDSFDIGSTHLFRSSETTLNESKIYHSFQTPDVHAKGERSINERRELLDELDFDAGETVLDIGCNAGLLCHYLNERGCQVWGIDIDPSIIEGARILANILGKEGIEFECLDIDNGGPLGYFDTVMLFSVIHHTRHINRNAARIAKLCKRIIIEARLTERGAKPVDGKWIQTTVWQHEDLDSLIRGLEALFPGFSHHETIGQGDRGRYVMEFRKNDA